MIEAILGRKIGMTHRYDESGTFVPVTVIQAGPCKVMQVKTAGHDGYEAIQLGFDDRKRKNAKKPQVGHARKAKTEPKKFVREVRFKDEPAPELGGTVTLEVLAGASSVDVTGVTKGKGFQGVMKRHGFHGRPASHGASKDHRRPGSIGASASPSRVWRGARMPGRMGGARCTVRNLRVVKLDKEQNLLFVRGGIPGPTGVYVIVRRGIKYR